MQQSLEDLGSLRQLQAQVTIEMPAVSGKCWQSIVRICQRLSEIIGDCQRLHFLEKAFSWNRVNADAGECRSLAKLLQQKLLTKIAGNRRYLLESVVSSHRAMAYVGECWRLPLFAGIIDTLRPVWKFTGWFI